MQTDDPAPGSATTRRPGVPAAAPGSVVPAPARPVQGRRAGLVTRVLADTVDASVVVAILALGYLGVCAILFLWKSWAFTFRTPSLLTVLVVGAIVAVLYLTSSWATTGRSYGGHLLGLRVVGPSGRLRVGHAFLRAVLCVLVPIGVLWVAVSRENRSLQDVVLRTSVVYDWLGGDEPPVPAQRSGR